MCKRAAFSFQVSTVSYLLSGEGFKLLGRVVAGNGEGGKGGEGGGKWEKGAERQVGGNWLNGMGKGHGNG
jgi:hypothetical protein